MDRNLLQERYPAIKAFIPTDCKTQHGIDDLKETICDILRDLKEVHEPFPSSWWNVKEYFGAAKHNYLPFTRFRTLCEERDLKEPDQQDSLARILHALGIILHYGEDARLKDTTVLNPQWVTNGVYHLLRLKDEQGGNGILTLEEAAAAMPDEPPEMVRYLIELMRRFELCYALDEAETRWLIPQVLTRYQPKLAADWTTAPATRLRYTYKVIPEGLLPRFIVRTHPLSEHTERWRNGVVLSVEGAQALVRAEHTENRITVTVQGEPEPRLRLVQLIRGHLQDIHASLPGLTPREEMEVTGYRNIYKDVATLERDERRRLTTTVETVDGSIPIEQTPQLNTISAPLKRQPDAPVVRVFVSYSQRDTRHLDVFKQNLKVMQMNGLITLWYDGLIKTGSEWDQDIRRELEEADIIVFMVSTNFLASDYILGVEMARAIQRKEAGEAEIVTLLLEPNCGWRKPHQLKPRGSSETITCELKKYQAIYPASKQARRWPIAPHAFNHVEDPLEDLRNQILAKRPASAALPRFRHAN
ncbi:COR domain-containing protein [Verrucomicrobium spinosum]|uniref:COR domain-containing protein n=1 Tax=Verrucomicrobium spinosum TaxID=2736 RepID=UPI0009466D6E|nr:COR domain-containing protein [Verrucomicrobium spinosum]